MRSASVISSSLRGRQETRGSIKLLVDDAVPVEPRARVDLRAARRDDLDVQVRPGRLTTVADLGDFLPGGHFLADLHQRAVDVPVNRNCAVGVPKPEAGPELITVPASGARIGVPIGAAMSRPW